MVEYWWQDASVSLRPTGLRWLRVVVLAQTLAVSFVAQGQEAARFDRLSELEASAELKTYRSELAAGGGFNDRHRTFLVNDGLGQLLAAGNRDRLAAVRARLPALFLDGMTNPSAFKDAAAAMVGGLEKMARGDRVAIEGSLNAALLLGELLDQDGQPLAAATPVLSSLVLDETVTPAVRVAALTGLGARVAAAGSGASPEVKQTAANLLPTLVKLVAADGPAAAEPGADGSSPVARRWLQARSLDFAVTVAPLTDADSKPLAEMRTAANALLQAADNPIDLRVRAAVLVAGLVKPDEAPVADELADRIDEVAVAAVVEDRQARELIALERSPDGFTRQAGGPMMGPGGEPLTGTPNLLPTATCLRTSWRLVSLAEAAAGLARTFGDEGAPYQQQADRLRDLGLTIYENPTDENVLAAATALAPVAAAVAEEGQAPQPDLPAADGPPGAPKPKTPFSPFQVR